MDMGNLVIFIALFVVLGAVILAGKGDFLIAGYNTASKEERDKVNIKRIRLLIAVLLFLCGALMPLLALDELTGGIAFAVIVMVACFVVGYLANTWAMKK